MNPLIEVVPVEFSANGKEGRGELLMLEAPVDRTPSALPTESIIPIIDDLTCISEQECADIIITDLPEITMIERKSIKSGGKIKVIHISDNLDSVKFSDINNKNVMIISDMLNPKDLFFWEYIPYQLKVAGGHLLGILILDPTIERSYTHIHSTNEEVLVIPYNF